LLNCDCDNILRSYGAFISEGCVNIALEYMNLGSLQDILRNVGRISESVMGIITFQILKGLEYLHKEMKIIHRDIKPSNILINRNGGIKIADFGVSGIIENSTDGKTSWVGTIIYMSPERVRGDEYYADTDIWSLGLTLVECVLGRFPYPDPSDGIIQLGFWELMEYINLKPAPTIPKEEFSEEFQDFLSICLRKKAGTRSTASELLKHSFIRRYENIDMNIFKNWLKTL